jgi:PII-like signaling protein
MLLSNMTHFHLGINWFYKSNEFVTDKIAEIIKEFPIISDIVLQTYYQYSA